MGRVKKDRGQRIPNPASRIAELRNNGEITVYDRLKGEKLENADSLSLIFLRQTWHWYKVKLDGSNKPLNEWSSGLYTEKSDKINLYYKDYLDKSKNQSLSGTVEVLRATKEDKDLSTGCVVYAVDLNGIIYAVKMPATGMYVFGKFQEATKFEPDFSVHMRTAVEADKTKAKNVPEFIHYAPKLNESQLEIIEAAQNEVDVYISKKVGKYDPAIKIDEAKPEAVEQ